MAVLSASTRNWLLDQHLRWRLTLLFGLVCASVFSCAGVFLLLDWDSAKTRAAQIVFGAVAVAHITLFYIPGLLVLDSAIACWSREKWSMTYFWKNITGKPDPLPCMATCYELLAVCAPGERRELEENQLYKQMAKQLADEIDDLQTCNSIRETSHKDFLPVLEPGMKSWESPDWDKVMSVWVPLSHRVALVLENNKPRLWNSSIMYYLNCKDKHPHVLHVPILKGVVDHILQGLREYRQCVEASVENHHNVFIPALPVRKA